MSYGLGAGGSRNVARQLAPPPRSNVTQAAPRVAAARAGRVPETPARIWGSIPVEQVEGHQVAPAYDVLRPGSFTWKPLRSERLYEGGLGFVFPSPQGFVLEESVAARGTQPGALNPSDPPRLASMLGAFGGGSSLLPLLAVGVAVFLLAVKR
ncbi:MAG: hypothetical protein ACREI9_04615 [Nitrospiraceae bacterium]